MKLTSNTYEVMTKYLFFSNFTRDIGMSAFISAIIFGSGCYIFNNFDELKVFFVEVKKEDDDEFKEDISPKSFLAIKTEPESEKKPKSWVWFM